MGGASRSVTSTSASPDLLSRRPTERVSWRACTASAVAAVPRLWVIGGSGIDVAPSTQTTWELIFAEEQVLLCQTSPLTKERLGDSDWRSFGLLQIGWEGLRLYVGGAGELRRGGGFFGGGFSQLGVAEGKLMGSMLNTLTSSATSDAVLRLQKPSAELYLFHDALAPQALRAALAPVFDRLRQTEAPSAQQAVEAGDDVVDRLGKLADLLDRGAITHDEFNEMKARLLSGDSRLLSDSAGRGHGMHLRFSLGKPIWGRPRAGKRDAVDTQRGQDQVERSNDSA